MRPVAIECRVRMEHPPEEIAARVLDVSQWTKWRGWGLVPAIRSARFRSKTDAVVGSLIDVQNADGTTHVEEILEWRPRELLCLRMQDFSPPLRSLATHFVETWAFGKDGILTRRYVLHPRGIAGAIALRIVAPMLRRATARHLREM